MSQLSKKTLRAIQKNFHSVIRERAGKLVDKYELQLPILSKPLVDDEHKAWFCVPGMYGGFSYWFDRKDKQIKLICGSWCRIVEGSEQRHEISVHGNKLVSSPYSSSAFLRIIN